MQRICETCQTVFHAKPSRVLIGKGRFCTVACYKTWRSPFKDNPEAGINKSSRNGCWLWLGGEDGRGYGQTWNGTCWEKSHRFFYKKYRGPIPKGLCVCHHCDTPLCVNPAHLFLGTPKDNHADSMAKGRAKFPPPVQGCDSSRAKLNPQQVRDIRARYSFRKCTSVSLAKEYGVSPPVVLLVAHGKSYRNVG